MDSWFNKGRPALLEALTSICCQIDHDITKELQKETDHEPVLSERVESADQRSVPANRGAASPGFALTDGVLGTSSHDTKQAVNPVGGLARDSCVDEKNWHSEYVRLSHKYHALDDNFKKAKEALQKRRHERDQWIQHAKLLEKKLREAETEHGIQILGQYTTEPDTLPGPHDEDGQRLARSSSPRHDLTEGLVAADAAAENVSSLDTRSTSPQTASEPSRRSDEPSLPDLPAQDEAILKIKEEPSSDDAVFVEERSLRKRRLSSNAEDVSNHRKLKVESSDHGSSPLAASPAFDFGGSDSIDLGGQLPAILTPRRQRQREPPAIHEGQPTATNNPGPRGGPHTDIALPNGYVHTSTLTPVNRSVQHPHKPASTNSLAKSHKKGLGHGIAVLAEDGTKYGRTAQDSPSVTRAKQPVSKSRLDTLLNTRYTEDQGKLNRPSTRGRQTSPTTHDKLAMPKPRDLPFERNAGPIFDRADIPVPTTPRPPLADATNIAHTRIPSTTNKKKKSRGTLRHKPVSELKLDDFKINLNLNDGHDFAFSEVVRNKDDRACLPGCVDMHCCGKEFRALALSQRPNSPLTPEQRQEEQKLLEDYLGDYCYRLATMSKEERAEVWVEAKMRELANKYGRHRHRFSRMRSPPGFWNADFPSTQELEDNRAEAGKRERQKIQERYREAMRPDGRWQFRDE